MSSGSDHEQTLVYIIFLGVLMAFVLVGGWMESHHLRWGHETGFIIVFGMLISFLVWTFDSHTEAKYFVFQFDTSIFFDFLLPSILFAAGYNMRRKQFFNNFTNIVKFGIFGSIFTFVFFFLFTYLLFKWGNLQMWDPTSRDGEGDWLPFELSTMDIMLVCSVLVSSDIIAAMSILKFEEQPHIFSIILGEGLFNDVVVIVLYQTVQVYQSNPEEEFNTSTAFGIIGNFIKLCFLSVLIGVIMGFAVTYIMKRLRYLSHSAI